MSIFTKFKKYFKWEYNSNVPQYDLNPIIYSKLKPIRSPLILIQILMMVGTLAYVYLEDYTIMQAIFQTSYTITNTGFGALNESNFKNETILFTVFLMLAGFMSLIFAVGVVIDVFTNGNLRELLRERRMLYKIARLRRHFVLCYHNEYTAQVAKQFRENQIPFVVVDSSDDIEAIAKAVAERKVETIIIEENIMIPGKIIDESGNIRLAEADEVGFDDLIDDLGEMVVRQKGRLLVLSNEDMPVDTGIAAIYRY